MTSRPSISAVVITAGRNPHLTSTMASLSWCDERLVVASNNVDDVATLPGASAWRIESHPFEGYGRQKRHAVSRANHDWVLSLDDDELLDEEAMQAIHNADFTTPSGSFSLRRRTFVGRQEIRHGAWGRDMVVRLFDRRRCSFADLSVHEVVRTSVPSRSLEGSILHHSFASCGDVLSRSISYATPKAGIILSKGELAHAWMLPLRAVGAFSKSYLLQGGWRDGAAGFAVALARVIDSTLPRMIVLTATDTPKE